MKKQILIALLFSVTPLSLSHSAEVSPPSDGTGSKMAEWIERIYQANRPFESIDVFYSVLDEDGGIDLRRHITLDLKKKLLLKTSITPQKESLGQAISTSFFDNGNFTKVNYYEKRTPDLRPSFREIKDGYVHIYKVPEIMFRARLFFNFDDDFFGNRFCNAMRALSPDTLWKKAEEVEFKGRKCLKFSGPFTIIFEKERGIVLERMICHPPIKKINETEIYEKVEYSDHQLVDGIWFPMTVHFSTFTGGLDKKPGTSMLRIRPEDVRLNHKIPEGDLHPKIPKGAEVYDDINDLHYISTGFSKERENSIKKQLDEIFEESEK
jgi:hypothetical protein